MSPVSRRSRVAIGGGIGVIAIVLVLAATGPRPDLEMNSTIRRMGGPCLQLEQWGLFGWSVIGTTGTMTQATNGDWQAPDAATSCQDVEDGLVLVRLPPDATPDSYRICGTADDEGCLVVRAVPFEGDGPGP